MTRWWAYTEMKNVLFFFINRKICMNILNCRNKVWLQKKKKNEKTYHCALSLKKKIHVVVGLWVFLHNFCKHYYLTLEDFNCCNSNFTLYFMKNLQLWNGKLQSSFKNKCGKFVKIVKMLIILMIGYKLFTLIWAELLLTAMIVSFCIRIIVMVGSILWKWKFFHKLINPLLPWHAPPISRFNNYIMFSCNDIPLAKSY